MTRASDRPAPPARARGLDLAIAAALVLATALLYAPVRHHAFLNYDDDEYVTAHPLVRAGLTRAGIVWALTGVHQATWHPLTSLTHLLDVELFGLDAGAHLLVNVALHAAAAAVLFLVLRAMTGARWPSAWVAALFAWHPLHVESVAWVSERKDVLSGLVWMLTLAAYLGWVRHPSGRRWGLVVAVFAAGLLAKPMLVTLPFVLLLLDWWPLGRLRGRADAAALVREKLPLFLLAAAVSAATVAAQRSAGAVTTLASAPLAYRIGNALVSYATYLRKMVWPTDLAVFYPSPPSLPVTRVLAAAAVLLALSALVLRFARRHPALLVGWLWYLGTLVPVIGLVRQGEQAMADRFTYLPAIGVFLAVAWTAPRLGGGAGGRRGLAAAAVIALGACLAASARQIGHWRDSVTLFTHAAAVVPDNYLAYSNLGIALAALGRHDEAGAHFARAVAIRPADAKVRLNLGTALARAGRSAEAEAEYRAALRLDPRLAAAAYDLGLLLAERGDLAAARAAYRDALAIDPRYAKAWASLGWVLAAEGDAEAAVDAYERALGLDATLAAAHNNLALTLADLGRPVEALAHADAALALAPGEARAHANRGVLLAGMERRAEAITALETALRLDPSLAEVRSDLAALRAAAR